MKCITQLFIIWFLGINVSVSAEKEPKQFIGKSTMTSNSIQWGVNIHAGGTNPTNIANKLTKRNLKFARMDLWGQDPVYLANFITVAKIMKAKNIKVQVVVNSLFTNGQSRSQDYTANLDEVEQSVYNQIKPDIISTKDLVSDYELQNEIPLYPNMNLAGTTGQNESDYDTPAGRLQAAALRGISKAIDDVRKLYNLPTRIILGTVDRRFGFLLYMQHQNVQFDVVGYHIYPWEKHASLDQDPWFGQGGPLGQLAKFNKPIHINEFNSGEIYSNYENKASQPVTETGYRGIYKHLNEIVTQTVANVEAVYFYEIYDETNKTIPENHFGLYYDTGLANPKISLLIATAFAGGTLSPAEKDSLTQRSFTYYNTITGISKNEIGAGISINIFPNPVKSLLKIQSPVAFNSIQIYNSLGKKFFSKHSDWIDNTDLNLINLSAGIYAIEINTKEENIVKTLIKL